MRSSVILVCLLLTGCVSESQRFYKKPDGSYTFKARRTTFGMNSSVAGLSSEWQVEDAIYGSSLSNLNTIVETKLVEAVASGVVKGLMTVK